ncbi:MAG: protein kinase domain-containing protein [Pseudanabaena sp.]
MIKQIICEAEFCNLVVTMLVGKTLKNRYKILTVLGSGGFGDTYLAQDIDLPGHPTCVVKQLKPKDPSPNVLPIAKGLFDREAEYLYKLGNAHTQIPKLFAHFEENNEFFLVQEFVEGHSLAEEIPIGQRLSESATTTLLLEILEVLAFVHQNNIIHRDIKLTNIMRRRQDGKIVLIDFGAVKDISALKTDSQGHTDVTVSIGSPGYMPSEQARGKPRLSSDVYAVGMIGIQALTGIAPDSLQEDANTGEILWRDRVQVSDAFAEVLQNMVFYHFSQRYKSAIEALHAMQSLGATKINNIAPTEAIAYPSSTSDSSPTIITNTNKVTVPVSAPTTPQLTPTTPQSPVTTPHVTVSAPNPAFSKFQPFLWIALTAVISVSAAIATAILIPKLTNRPPDNNPQTEVTKAATSPPIASPTTPPSPEPTETAILAPEPPPVVETTNPTMPSFGAIARSPSTQSKGYSWNYASRKAAETRALSECESSSTSGDCQVLIWAKNACISLAESSNGAAGSGWSEDITVAENTAKQVCKEFKGINCTITNTICLPVR